MDNIKMYTREEVSELFHIHVNSVTMLREAGVLESIKIGKNYMFPQEVLKNFQKDYLGLDCSNMKNAVKSKFIVIQRRQEMEEAE